MSTTPLHPPYPPALLAAARGICDHASLYGPHADKNAKLEHDIAWELAHHWPPAPTEEAAALAVEVERLKTGITQSEVTMIVDGGDMCDWGWMTQRDANARIREASRQPAPLPLPPDYLSFLLCLHGHETPRQLVNTYVNGQPLGQIDAAGTFQPHGRPMADGSKQATRFRDVAEPCPFGTLAELKAFLHEAVEWIELEPEPTKQQEPVS